MICSLLVFLNMFETSWQSIDHYNGTRASNWKALTIKSQWRYVKYFTGFLYLKLGNKERPDQRNWLEYALKKHGFKDATCWENIFDEMYKQKVDLHSICFGPFPEKRSTFDLKITKLTKNEKKTRSSGLKVVNYDTEEKIMGMLNQDSLESILEWKLLKDEETEQEKWFLTIKLFSLEGLP